MRFCTSILHLKIENNLYRVIVSKNFLKLYHIRRKIKNQQNRKRKCERRRYLKFSRAKIFQYYTASTRITHQYFHRRVPKNGKVNHHSRIMWRNFKEHLITF